MESLLREGDFDQISRYFKEMASRIRSRTDQTTPEPAPEGNSTD
jgi:hypothetical protein